MTNQRLEKNSANYTSDKELISRIHKALSDTDI